MPFDGVGNFHPSLVDTLTELGITPIPDTTLQEHMERQCRDNPGNWGFHHRKLLLTLMKLGEYGFVIGVGIGLVMIITGFVMTSITGAAGNDIEMMIHGGVYSIVASIIVCLVVGYIEFRIVMRGPARWIIKTCTFTPNVRLTAPEPIKAILNQIAEMRPNCLLDYGELRQETEVIDPFVRLHDQTTGATAVIGIWDDTGILHIATIAA